MTIPSRSFVRPVRDFPLVPEAGTVTEMKGYTLRL